MMFVLFIIQIAITTLIVYEFKQQSKRIARLEDEVKRITIRNRTGSSGA